MTAEIKRGQIYYADLSPVRGSEQGGMRPVIIIQNDIGNKHSPTVIICPITSQVKNSLPTHTYIATKENICGTVMCEQIRTIDKSRLRKLCDTATAEDMRRLDKAIKIALAIY